MATDRYLGRAANATRSSKRVALRDSVDYVELVRDVAAMANSGGGVIVLDGIAGVDEELLHEQLGQYAEPEFEGLDVDPLRVQETVSIKSEWLGTGQGKSNASATGGSLAADATLEECWNTSFQRTYFTDSWNSSETEGDAASCKP